MVGQAADGLAACFTHLVERGEPVASTATGAVSYSFDLNGDGVMDLTNATGIAMVDTTGVGIISPLVIGEGADSTMNNP